MLDSLNTAIEPVIRNILASDYTIPQQGIIYSANLATVDYSLDFHVLDGSQAIITAYGLDDDTNPDNHIELHKIMYSAGKPSEFRENCSPCGKTYKPEELSTIVLTVRICDVNITKCKPLLLINVAGHYRLKIGAGVQVKEDVLLHIQYVNSKLDLGFKNL